MLKKRSAGLTTQTLLDFDLEESSSDSDFRIEDHDDDSDDYSENSKDEEGADNGEEDSDSEDESDSDFSETKFKLSKKTSKTSEKTVSAGQLLDQLKIKDNSDKVNLKLLLTPICCACLGDRSDDTNEIVECDGCGVTVHEGCYGVNDTASVSSTVSSCSTEPWFCEACKAGILDPVCELCPNKGGIFKETDVGKWVHLICALYVPGVAFGEVDQLSSVTLFEMPYSKWGAKTCSICEDARFARTGVCIGCDAGMCKTYFHVTCAQSNGLLSEAHSEEADHADPFYAHCKIHSDKTLVKHRKRNFNALRLRMEQRQLEQEQSKSEKPTNEQQRIERKLKKHKNKYITNKTIKSEPWVPTQKMPRLLATSASACRRLILKAELMGIDAEALEFQEAQMLALADVRKKWHIPPAFNVEFIGYYLDRITRLRDIKINLQEQLNTNKNLIENQQILRDKYDQAMKINEDFAKTNASLKQSIQKLHTDIQALCPNKTLPSIENIGRPIAVVNVIAAPPARPMTVPTAAALKMGVGFPLNNLPGTKNDTGKILSTQRQNNDELLHECGICKRCNDQHLLAKCDTCHFYYHLGCLNPPLTRHPKKCKLYGWQCSECDKSDDSDADVTLPKGPRKSRTRYSKDGIIVPVDAVEKSPDKIEPIPQPKVAKKAERKASINGTAIQPNTPEKNEATLMTPCTVDVTKEIIKPIVNKSKKGIKKSKILAFENRKSVAENEIDVSAVNISSENVVKSLVSPSENAPASKEIASQIPSNESVNNPFPIVQYTSQLMSSDILSEKVSKSKSEKRKAKKEKRSHQQNNPNEPTYYIENGTQDQSVKNLSDYSSAMQYMPQFTSEIVTENATNLTINETSHKQNRKRRKEKHKNKYSSDTEKTPSKEHKRKRKRKYDMENTTAVGEFMSITEEGPHPRIKIKFKAIPVPSSETSTKTHFMYVSQSDIDRPMEICRSRQTSMESLQENSVIQNSPKLTTTNETDNRRNLLSSPTASVRSSRLSSISSTTAAAAAPAPLLTNKRTKRDSLSTSVTSENSFTELICDVCQTAGTTQNLVKCDECKKNYHFTCLDPPVKKTPKRRGYSWHCADCDPTENESN